LRILGKYRLAKKNWIVRGQRVQRTGLTGENVIYKYTHIYQRNLCYKKIKERKIVGRGLRVNMITIVLVGNMGDPNMTILKNILNTAG